MRRLVAYSAHAAESLGWRFSRLKVPYHFQAESPEFRVPAAVTIRLAEVCLSIKNGEWDPPCGV